MIRSKRDGLIVALAGLYVALVVWLFATGGGGGGASTPVGRMPHIVTLDQ
jgi:hypothetical protein